MEKSICPICGLQSLIETDDGLKCELCQNIVSKDKNTLIFPNIASSCSYHLASIISGNYEYKFDEDYYFDQGYDFEEIAKLEEDTRRRVTVMKGIAHFTYPIDTNIDYRLFKGKDAFEKFMNLHHDYPNSSTPYWGLFKAKYHIVYTTYVHHISYFKNETRSKAYCFYPDPFEIDPNDEYYQEALKYAETPELRKAYEEEFKKIVKTVKDFYSQPFFTHYDAYYDLDDKYMDEEMGILDALPSTSPDSNASKLYKYLQNKNLSIYSDYHHKSLFSDNSLEKERILKDTKTIVLYGDEFRHIDGLVYHLKQFFEQYDIDVSNKTFIIISNTFKELGLSNKEIFISNQDSDFMDKVYNLIKNN